MPRCYQRVPFGGIHLGQEDCLYLNVYTPVTEEGKLLPVMVFIHGGGFVTGEAGSVIYGPHYFMDEGVVLVTLHYRLGIFGFLSLETEEAPGNLGMWDQREALIWVRDNIASFGGSPHHVTLFGESAGSMSVNFHLVSHQSRGLFHSAILQSGTAISPYTALRKPPSHYARSLSAELGCPVSEDPLPCLQSLSPSHIYKHLLLFNSCSVRDDLGLSYPGPWVPGVDKATQEPFLPRDPEEVLRSGADNGVPVMIGFNSEEGLLYTSRFQKDPDFQTRFQTDWDSCAPINFLGLELDQVTVDDVSRVNTLRSSYSPGNPGLTDMFTDAVFASSSHQVARLLCRNKRTVYKYLFTYRGSISSTDFLFSGLWSSTKTFLQALLRIPWFGVSSGSAHVDELFYLFQVTPILELLITETDQAMSRSMVTWWTNFAKTGNPDPDWEMARKGEDYRYWVIDTHSNMEDRQELVRLEQWLV